MRTEESESIPLANDLELLPPKIIDGKDELNLAEFPLSAISARLSPEQKTLTFEDRIWDESRSEVITRHLSITASDQHGLPTALDDEVILGLVQLSKLRHFSERSVPFTRYQLIQLLGWRDEGKSYERLETSLKRWLGVTLYYKNAWWSKKDLSWVDENFHILDRVTLYDRENARSRTSKEQAQLPLSSFTWNDVLFRSFETGNLKSIDFDFYKSLKSSIAKRLYRFLDKRFWHRARWEFDLKEVSWEHVGLARSHDTFGLKRKLLIGIRELEEKGFLQRMPDSERFRKVRSGEWRVTFEEERSKAKPSAKPSTPDSEALAQALLERGVTPSTAQQIVATYPPERIRTQLEVFDWLLSQHDPRLSRNPAGFLISSIKSEYAPPKAFVGREEQAKRAAQAAERKERAEERERAKAEQENAKQTARETTIRNFWASFSDEERKCLEAEALEAANNLQRELIGRGGAFAQATKTSLLDAYAMKVLQQGT